MPVALKRNEMKVKDEEGNYVNIDVMKGDKGDPGDSVLPDPPSIDGTYALQLTVSEGVATYTWVSAT